MKPEDKAVVQQALEFLEMISPQFPPLVHTIVDTKRDEAITALRQLLDQPEQEPESFEQWNAKQHGDPEEIGFLQALRIAYCAGQDSVAMTTPPAQPAAWVGLTDEDYPDADNPYCCLNSDFIEGARWASAKLREKNGGA
jgi:hypothetical protein